jgi:hypothetical protein
MKKRLTAAFYCSILFYTASCASENAVIMTEAPFSDSAPCMMQWEELFEEWKKNGGGLKESISATRNQIVEDNHSRFAHLVRDLWHAQSLSDAEDLSSEHLREINTEDSMRVSASLYHLKTDQINSDCKIQMYPYAMFAKEMISGANAPLKRPDEAPPTMDWSSPSAQHWVTYWIFVRSS